MFLDLANLSAITIALPTIQKELDIDIANLQWIISGYALTVHSTGPRALHSCAYRKRLTIP